MKKKKDKKKELDEQKNIEEGEASEVEIKKEKKAETIEEKCLRLEQEKGEATGKYLRLLAEFENYRRRNEKERVDWIKNATAKLTLKVCDVLDDFERALEVEPGEKQFEQFLKGVESIYKKLEKVINSEGVQKIKALGEDFNPMYHEALSYLPSDEEPDKIISVIQNGYVMGNKVIRAAKVAVSAGQQVQPEDTENNGDNQS